MAISYVGGAVGTTTATLPTHAANDLILAFAHRDGNTTAPTLPSGWTDIGSGGANVNSSRLAYKVAASSGETSGTWTNATGLLILVYRGTDTTTPIGGFTAGGASSLNVAYPAVTMTDTSGASWVVGVFGHRSTDINLTSAPTGMTNRTSQQDATASISGFDTNGGVSSWTLQTVTHTGSTAGWRSWTVELLEAAGSGSVTGDLAATEGADTAEFSGSVLVSGDLAATEGSDTASIVEAGGVDGTLAAVEGADSASLSGSVLVSGSLAATEGADSAAFVGLGATARTQTIIRYVYRPYENVTERRYVDQLNQDLRTIYGQISGLSKGAVASNDTRESAPAGGSWQQGDFVRKFSPTEDGATSSKYVILGWVCVASGSPGTWVECRCLTGN